MDYYWNSITNCNNGNVEGVVLHANDNNLTSNWCNKEVNELNLHVAWGISLHWVLEVHKGVHNCQKAY